MDVKKSCKALGNDLNKIILPITKISVSSGVDIKSLPVCPELATLSNSEQNLNSLREPQKDLQPTHATVGIISHRFMTPTPQNINRNRCGG